MSPFTWLALLAQSEPQSNPWAQLGVAGAIVGFAVWIISLLISQNRELRTELKQSNDRILEVAERALPSIAENTRVLSEVLEEVKRMRGR